MLKKEIMALIILAVLGVLFALPFMAEGYILALVGTIFLFAVLASGWNLMAGFCGYINFGYQVFFGIGAFIVAVLVSTLNLGASSMWYTVVIGGAASAIFAWLIGYPALRLRGPYFSILTLALCLGVTVIVTNLPWFGGAEGLCLPPLYLLPQFYWITLITFIMCLLTLYFIRNSSLGLASSSILQDQDAAEGCGVNTLRIKQIIFMISGFFPGVVGGAYAWWVTYIDASSVFSFHWMVEAIAMTIFGGMGTIVGPVIGAVVFSLISEYLWTGFPELYLIILGVLIILMIQFMPRGIWGLIQRGAGTFRRTESVGR